MTREEAEKVGKAIADAAAYSDKDVAIRACQLLSDARVGWCWKYTWEMDDPEVEPSA